MAEEGNKNEEKNNIKNSKIGSIVKQFSSDLESVVADKNTSNMMKVSIIYFEEIKYEMLIQRKLCNTFFHRMVLRIRSPIRS